MSLTIQFIGHNDIVNELGSEIKNISLRFAEGDPVDIANGGKEKISAGELYRILVTFNNDVVRRYDVSTGYVFKEYVTGKIIFSIAQTTISIVSDAGVGGELKLVV